MVVAEDSPEGHQSSGPARESHALVCLAGDKPSVRCAWMAVGVQQ